MTPSIKARDEAHALLDETSNPNGTRLAGKLVWVTGAGKGLGRAIATRLAQDGATVLATARSADTLESLGSELPPGSIISAPGSVTNEAHIERILDSLDCDLHGLVNCAGISPAFVRTEHLEAETLRSVLETNTVGTFLCAQAAGRLMLAQQSGGSIVNVSSVHGQVGFPRIAAYAASKGAVESLTATMAVEWADRGVRVNTVSPGYFDTDLSHGLLTSSWGDRIRRSTPMGRTGKLSEIAGAVKFLLSEDATFITGANLRVDGGWQAW